MQPDLNKHQIMGLVCTSPEFRRTAGGREMVRFAVVTMESWRDPMGVRREKSEIHYVVVFNDFLVSLTKKALRRGSRVMVEGRMERRHYTDGFGVVREVVELVVGAVRSFILALDEPGEPDLPKVVPERFVGLPEPELAPWADT